MRANLPQKEEKSTETKDNTKERFFKDFVSAQTVVCVANTTHQAFLSPRRPPSTLDVSLANKKTSTPGFAISQ